MGRGPQPLLALAEDPQGWSRPPKRRECLIRYSDGTWRAARVEEWLHHPGRGWFVRIR